MKIRDLKTVYRIEGVKVKLTDSRGKVHKLGPYCVRIKKGKRLESIYDLAKVLSVNGDLHPHVSPYYNTPCLGNIREIVYGLYNIRDYEQIGELLVRLLNSYDEDDPHIFLGYCDDCCEYIDDCECDRTE